MSANQDSGHIPDSQITIPEKSDRRQKVLHFNDYQLQSNRRPIEEMADVEYLKSIFGKPSRTRRRAAEPAEIQMIRPRTHLHKSFTRTFPSLVSYSAISYPYLGTLWHSSRSSHTC